ncbi:MAG TPA: nucleotidyltransferase [Tissierellaceae bacterium]|nr:nucleotidyltransferase [Tissierellaceae bacterium]
MKTIGFITEYNPFHHGHKYHLEQSLSETQATHSLAIMSSSFVQRGEPSIVDKWTKTKMAINNGIDLVIELPFIYSTQSAELFAYGAINIMESLNIVDYISFGSEIGDLEPLANISNILLEEPYEYKNHLQKSLNKGLSFPASRNIAISNFLRSQNKYHSYDYTNILKQSNNILGIEYLKSLTKLNSSIKPVTIARKGANYKNSTLDLNLSSATGIRNSIFKNGVNSVEDFVPIETFQLLLEYKNKHKVFNTLSNYEPILNFLLLTKDPCDISQYFDVNEGLENRIISCSETGGNIYDIIEKISTKRYPKTRIQRILLHILIDLRKSTINLLFKNQPPYIRVLGSNKKGYEILRKIKDNSNIPIIQKFTDYKDYQNVFLNKFIKFEKKATDLYYFGLNSMYPLVNMDYKTSQYNQK